MSTVSRFHPCERSFSAMMSASARACGSVMVVAKQSQLFHPIGRLGGPGPKYGIGGGRGGNGGRKGADCGQPRGGEQEGFSAVHGGAGRHAGPGPNAIKAELRLPQSNRNQNGLAALRRPSASSVAEALEDTLSGTVKAVAKPDQTKADGFEPRMDTNGREYRIGGNCRLSEQSFARNRTGGGAELLWRHCSAIRFRGRPHPAG